MAELEFEETIIVPRHEELLHEVRQHYAEAVSIWKEIFAESRNRMVNDVKVAKADSGKMFVKINLILSFFQKHDSALPTRPMPMWSKKGYLSGCRSKNSL